MKFQWGKIIWIIVLLKYISKLINFTDYRDYINFSFSKFIFLSIHSSIQHDFEQFISTTAIYFLNIPCFYRYVTLIQTLIWEICFHALSCHRVALYQTFTIIRFLSFVPWKVFVFSYRAKNFDSCNILKLEWYCKI